ncbi:hypothetical protein LCGC14_2312070 [marine sediment metagenome]|uniref:Uncharacterized protein n=1 Tax=marine sediment metagenome TaxID=412755 RepID=A0A0F9CKG1_9ZZZZ
MSEWRPGDWPERPCDCHDTWCLQCTEWKDREAGADAMMAGLMKHLRDAADRNLELAQSAIYNDSLAFPRISNQLTRDSTAFLIVADYIEYDRLRLIGKDPYPAISDEKDG